jgi:putative ABC transport system permease protein
MWRGNSLMFITDNVKSSLAIIMSHKIRTLLTLIGIIIGVLAVVAMFAAVDGVKKTMQDSVGKMGWNNSFEVVPKTNDDNGSGRWRRRRRRNNRESKPLTLADFRAIRKEIDCKYIYGWLETTSFDRKSKLARWIYIKATTNDYFQLKEYNIFDGRNFNPLEHKKATNVCLIGYYFWKETMGAKKDVIGQKLTLGDYRYTIIGIIGEDIDTSKNSFDWSSWQRRWDLKSVFIPLSTGAKNYSEKNSISNIYVQSEDDNQYQFNKNKTRQILLSRHSMVESFEFNNISKDVLEFTQRFEEMVKKWNTILLAIASVSLFVGGIGLFSTLLISISERMNEIGIRKSIGATNSDIFMLLLSEAIILTLIGAGIGVVLARIIIIFIGKGLQLDLGLPFQGVLTGLAFALVIGILSGIYPAYKASKVSPIEAVYYQD